MSLLNIKLGEALDELHRSQNKMDSSTFGGRCRTEEIQRKVDRIRAEIRAELTEMLR